MKLELINIGRDKISKTVEIKNPPTYKKILNEVSKHLLSRGIDFADTSTPGTYDVAVGMFRKVGQIKIDPNINLNEI